MARDRPHILLDQSPRPERYRRPPRRIDPTPIPRPANPARHARALRDAIIQAEADVVERRRDVGFTVPGARPGIYLVFRSPASVRLALDRLQAARSGIEVVSFAKRGDHELATVFVPDGKLKHFLKRLDEYVNKRTVRGERKHNELVDRIEDIKAATLRAFWTDALRDFPAENVSMWWEVWLRVTDGHEEERLATFGAEKDITIGSRRLTFPDRIVRVVRATPEQLSESIEVLGDLAELRAARESPGAFTQLDPIEQAEWVDELVGRIVRAPRNAPSVCVLDSGVNRGHPLLQPSLAVGDAHAVDPAWGPHDHDGHGTEMAGLALLGDLGAVFVTNGAVRVRHHLESVKILPPVGQNDPRLYGAITAEAVARVEVQAPTRPRAFSMSITAGDGREVGQPTSWSAAIDAIAAGRSFEPTSRGLTYLEADGATPRRLFLVSAGNVHSTDLDHIARSDVQSIQDPAQAWNALTIGACTDLVYIDPNDSALRGWSPVAAAGDLSPYSSTSVPFATAWPLKPDVVFEGGNKASDGRAAFQVDSLSLVSTNFQPQQALLRPTWATSASTAQVARFAGDLAAEYPNFWPETIRALIVHSAEWTERMKARGSEARGRRQRERLLFRRFGFGVPSLERARLSARDILTLVAQDSLRPFEDGKLCEMKTHVLPWPTDVLTDLGEEIVRLRVTLSYFVEPNPARRGWRNRYRYASHGLRFDTRRATESLAEFKARLNQLARDEDEERTTTASDASEWQLGPDVRHRGSLHGDIWTGPAAELARRGVVGIFPVSGWWKDQPARDRSAHGARYALVVSIEAEDLDVDIWTPVAQQVGVEVPIS